MMNFLSCKYLHHITTGALLCLSAMTIGQVTTVTYTYTGAIETFTVPECVNTLSMQAWGAQGGNALPNSPGGLGAYMSGVFSVTPGQVLKILVGGKPADLTGGIESIVATGGGGGSFISTITNTPLLVAGGGGGRRSSYSGVLASANGVITTSAQSSNPIAWSGAPGTNGNGGQSGEPNGGGTGGPGGGFYTNGGPCGTNGGGPGIAFVNGGTIAVTCAPFSPSTAAGNGGFGGGGAGAACWRLTPGGGGGYSGGATGVNDGAGGGGGSYNAGSSQVNTAGVRVGNGEIVISFTSGLSPISITAQPSLICIGGNATLTAAGLQSFTWSTGSNSPAISVSPTITTFYTVQGTNSLGCVSSSIISVDVDESTPSIAILTSSNAVCPGDSVTITASGANSYSWTGGVINGAAFTPTGSASFTVTGANSCGTATGVTAVTVHPAPPVNAIANTASLCLGNSAILTGSGATSYTWTGGVNNGQPFFPASSGSYTVTGSSAIGCTASAVTSINVLPFTGPSLSINPASASVCAGGSATLLASGVNSYTWNTGSNSTSVVVSPSVSTVYSVQGVNSSGCQSNAMITVSVSSSAPTLAVTGSSTSVCPGDSVMLTASGALSYTWSGGAINGINFTPINTAIYTVSGANACGSATAAITVTVLPGPSVTAVASSPTVCSGSSVILSGSGATSYTWSGGVSNGQPFFLQSSGIFTVTGANGIGCTGTATLNVNLILTPTLAPQASHSVICAGETSTLTAAGATGYTWQPVASSASVVAVNPSVTTVYTLTQSDSGCSDVKTLTVTVNPLPPVAILASSGSVCAGNSLTLTAAGAQAFTWQPGGLTNAVIIPSPTATIVYTVAAWNGNCSNTATVNIDVYPLPVISAVAVNSVLCKGDSTNITAIGGVAYTWQPIASSGSVLTVSPNVTTIYSIAGTSTAGCQSVAVLTVVVHPVPAVSANAINSLVCPGYPSTLTVTGADNYNWSNGATTSVIIVSPNAHQTYTVTGTTAATGCKTTQTLTVAVLKPLVSLTSNTSVCVGGSVTLTAGGATSYTWNGNQPFQSITVSPTVYTVYQLSATSHSGNISCVSNHTVGVSIIPPPQILAVSDRSVACRNEYIVLSASGASTYVWNTSQTGASISVVPVGNQITYTVTGTIAGGCSSTATVTVKVLSCTGITDVQDSKGKLSVSPNPGSAEVILASSAEMELLLTNSIGQVLAELSLNAGNNFRLQLIGLPEGVYFLWGKDESTRVNKKIVIVK